MSGPPPSVRIATRGSELARWQADHVADLLRAADPELAVEVVVVSTSGDREVTRPIWEIGGKGVFVKEVQSAVLDGRADLAVHSAKDLPSVPVEGLVLAAVPPRADPRDALVGHRLADLPPGARVATGSLRRRIQLAHRRPDLTFAGLRGNIATRLEQVGEHDAVVVAAAALERLGRLDEAAEILEPGVMLPQVGQGALAVECRTGDEELRARLGALDDVPSRRAVEAERAFLAELGGDCDLPAGAFATIAASGELVLDVLLASSDGHVVLRARRGGTDPVVVGRAAARHLLHDAGGAALLLDASA